MNKITTLFSAASFALAASISLAACGDDSSSAGPDEAPVSSGGEKNPEEGKECPAESEGLYASVLDTLAVYDDGNAMVCGISGYIVATGTNYKDCYLYTEEGWVSKGMSSSNCDEFL